jgi:hypothetical protein
MVLLEMRLVKTAILASTGGTRMISTRTLMTGVGVGAVVTCWGEIQYVVPPGPLVQR